jgi:hypothetical protein
VDVASSIGMLGKENTSEGNKKIEIIHKFTFMVM